MTKDFHHLQHGWFIAIFLFCAAVFLSNVAHWIVFRILRRKATETAKPTWGIQTYLGHPSRAVLMLTCVQIVLPIIPGLPKEIEASLRHFLTMAIVVAIGWFFIGCVYILQAYVLRRYDLTASDNLRARRIHTQFQVFRHLLIGFVIVITIGTLLWTSADPSILRYGSELLASAGIASIVLATAAKSTVSNVLAGIQIAFTEPIRIDDVVVVQGNWGRVEEITSAYVVIKIWDLRRLVVPLNYFVENSIENWTRQSSTILGSAFLYVDYSVPVEELRQELNRIVKSDPLWDGGVLGLQVTNLSERTMELRCLMSSADSARNFDLRCNVRERMTAFIREHHPDAFPTTRFAALPDTTGKAPPGSRIEADGDSSRSAI